MNKIAAFIILSIFSLGIVLSTGSCKKSNPEPKDYVISIDSIIHSDTITEGTILNIKFYGLIGTTSCESFSRFEVTNDPSTIEITAIGINSNGSDCTAETKYMNGSTLGLSNIPAGSYIIKVIEPTGTPPIESPLFVKAKS